MNQKTCSTQNEETDNYLKKHFSSENLKYNN